MFKIINNLFTKRAQRKKQDLPLTLRTEKFWNWFIENEKNISLKLPPKSQKDSDSLIELVSSGTKLISDNMCFNLGGKHAFTFSIEDWPDLFFIYPYIVSCMPKDLKSKWKFYPCNPGTDESFGFRIYDVDVDTAHTMVHASYCEESGRFDITYFDKNLEILSEDKSDAAFFVIMEQTLGDALSYLYIGDIKRSETLGNEMWPLPEMKKHIKEALKSHGFELKEDPQDNYTSYQLDPQQNDQPRYDIISGYTSLTPLLSDYYNDSTQLIDHIKSFGARAIFIAYKNPDGVDLNALTNLRYEIEDKITSAIIRPTKIARLIGGATGIHNCYIDLIVYDFDKFVNEITQLLKQYPHLSFYLSEFEQYSDKIQLT